MTGLVLALPRRTGTASRCRAWRRAARLAWGSAILLAGGSATAGLSLDGAVARDEPAVRQAGWSELPGFLPPEGLAAAVGTARAGPPPLIAAAFGPRGGARLQSGPLALGSAPLQWRLGLSWRAGTSDAARPFSLEGSSVAWQLDEEQGAGEFYASVQRRHWGPGWSGSLILDGAAPAVPAFGWRRTAVRQSANPWLGWIGPFGADIFFGRLQGHRQPARPYFIGMRAQLEPVRGLTMGLTRTMQWGGRGRDESSSSLVNSLLGNDNVGFDGINADNEPGNQLAGIDFRWVAHEASSTALYVQIVGEDEAGHLPSRNMLLAGLDTQVNIGTGRLRLFAEWADLLAGRISRDPRPYAAYRHSVYLQGYSQEGALLGHPAGGDVMLGTAGAVLRAGAWQAMVTFAAGRAEPTAQLFAPGRILGANGSLQVEAGAGQRLGFQAAIWQDRAGMRRSYQLWWLAPLGGI
jgi:hypothetical protein